MHIRHTFASSPFDLPSSCCSLQLRRQKCILNFHQCVGEWSNSQCSWYMNRKEEVCVHPTWWKYNRHKWTSVLADHAWYWTFIIVIIYYREFLFWSWLIVSGVEAVQRMPWQFVCVSLWTFFYIYIYTDTYLLWCFA